MSCQRSDSAQLPLCSQLRLATSTDLIFELQSSQTLMVENLTDMAPVEVEMSVGEVNESNACNEENQQGVVARSACIERIVTQLVTVWQIVDVMLFLPGVATCV